MGDGVEKVSGSGFRVWGLGFTETVEQKPMKYPARVRGSEFGGQGLGGQGLGVRGWRSEVRVQGLRVRDLGSGVGGKGLGVTYKRIV